MVADIIIIIIIIVVEVVEAVKVEEVEVALVRIVVEDCHRIIIPVVPEAIRMVAVNIIAVVDGVVGEGAVERAEIGAVVATMMQEVSMLHRGNPVDATIH
jgi:hypothetical protein